MTELKGTFACPLVEDLEKVRGYDAGTLMLIGFQRLEDGVAST